MNTENQTPRIHTNGETFLICANKAGFIHLRNRIDELLEHNSNSLTLETEDANDISTINLDDSLCQPIPQSTLTTFCLVAVLILLAASAIVGINTIASWIL